MESAAPGSIWGGGAAPPGMAVTCNLGSARAMKACQAAAGTPPQQDQSNLIDHLLSSVGLGGQNGEGEPIVVPPPQAAAPKSDTQTQDLY